MHILDAILMTNLTKRSLQRSDNPIVLPDSTHHNNGIWFSAFSKWLPHIWFDQRFTADSVSKHDDSIIPFEFWNNRIIKLFSWFTPKHCHAVRQLLHYRFCVNIWQNFTAFINYEAAVTTAIVSIKQRGVGRIQQDHQTISLYQ